MSGLNEIGLLPGFAYSGAQVAPRDIDQYIHYGVSAPTVSAGWLGTVSSATANAAFVLVNALPDYPRNILYSVTGVAGGMGGTFTSYFKDQFGGTVIESVVIGSAAGGGSTFGTQILGKFGSAVFSPAGLGGTAVGTASIGFGTISNGSAQSNWFGLSTKIQGTADVKNIIWRNNGTVTALNKGTAIGTLINLTNYGFQGTAGLTITDSYVVTFKPNFDNAGKAPLAGMWL